MKYQAKPIEVYEKCSHDETKTVEIPGTDETVTICMNCFWEV